MKHQSKMYQLWPAIPIFLALLLLALGCGGDAATAVPPTATNPTPGVESTVISEHPTVTMEETGTAIAASDQTPIGVSDRIPVLLVHGYKGGNPFDLLTSGCGDISAANRPRQDDPTRDFVDFEAMLSSIGYISSSIERVGLISSPCYTPRLADNVDVLKAEINKVKDRTGHDRVIIIAHSMGGLVARLYIEGNNYEDDVSHLITLGSPHVGINLSSEMLVTLLAPPLMKSYANQERQPVMRDFVAGEMRNQAPRRNPNVKYVVIDGHPDWPFGYSAKGLFIQWLAGNSPTDGLVSSDSGRFLQAEDPAVTIDFHVNKEAHSDDLGAPDYFFMPDSQTKQDLRKILAGITAEAPAKPSAGFAPKNDLGGSLQFAAANARYAQPEPQSVDALPEHPQPPCNAEEFLRLLAPAAGSLENHIGDVVAQYSIECKGPDITPGQLVEGAVRKEIPLNLRSVHTQGDKKPGLLVSAGGFNTGILEDGTTVDDIPGSRILQDNDSVYVFYPAIDATTIITNTGQNPDEIILEFVSGQNEQSLTIYTRKLPLDVNEIARILPGRDPNVETFPRNNPFDITVDPLRNLIEVPNFVQPINPQEVIPNRRPIVIGEEYLYPQATVQP